MNPQYNRQVTKPTPMKRIPELPEGWLYRVDGWGNSVVVQIVNDQLIQQVRVEVWGKIMRNRSVRKAIRLAYKKWQEKEALAVRTSQMRHVVADNGARV